METFKLAQSVHRTSGVCQNNLGEKIKYFGVRKGQQEEIRLITYSHLLRSDFILKNLNFCNY